MTYDLSVTSTLLGKHPVPDWYFGVHNWTDGLGTAYFALLAPAAMGCIGLAILRTRALLRRTGWVFLAATVALLASSPRSAGPYHSHCPSRSSPSASRP